MDTPEVTVVTDEDLRKSCGQACLGGLGVSGRGCKSSSKTVRASTLEELLQALGPAGGAAQVWEFTQRQNGAGGAGAGGDLLPIKAVSARFPVGAAELLLGLVMRLGAGRVYFCRDLEACGPADQRERGLVQRGPTQQCLWSAPRGQWAAKAFSCL